MRNQTAYIITSVKVNEVPMNKGRMIVHHAPDYAIPVETWEEHDAVMAVEKEVIEPFHIARQRPVPMSNRRDPFEERIIDEYFIFLPKEVQDSFGLIYEVWDDMHHDIETMHHDIETMHKVIDQNTALHKNRKAEGWFKRVYRGMVNTI